MIFYFTGTGNSRYIAEKIAEVTGEELISLNEKIKKNDISTIHVSDRLVFVTPTYAWRIPLIVQNWVEKTRFVGANQIWFVMNCGSEIGNAAKYNKLFCEKKGFSYMGTTEIVMPENYIAMFEAPKLEEAGKIIEKANPLISQAAEKIAANQPFSPPRNHFYDRFLSGIVNRVFYPVCVKADAFTAGSACIGCGKCEKLCPLNNIKMKEEKPVWGKECTHCMACICSCPTEAIEYGKKSVGKVRYHCDFCRSKTD